MTYDHENVFAKILRGELPKFLIYEDADTLSFPDIMPSVEGHTLVIPKAPATTIFDLSPEQATTLFRTTHYVADAVKRALNVPGIMLAQLNGVEAGQSVPHVHFHILPREQVELNFHSRVLADPEILASVATKIRRALNLHIPPRLP